MELTTLIGYAASIFLALSLIAKSTVRFRWFNLLGCLAFVIYGISISQLPVIIPNALLLTINAIALFKIYTTTVKEDYHLAEVRSTDNIAIKFLDFHKAAIQKAYHNYPATVQGNLSFLVLKDMTIAGIFIGEVNADGTAEMRLSYMLPNMADDKLGNFIFNTEKAFFSSKGVKQIIYTNKPDASQVKFLLKQGFEHQQINGKDALVLALA